MPRQARRLSKTGIYHTMLRGINRQQIFEDEEDSEKFIQVLKDCKAVSEFELYAYCLMDNHIHLLIKPEKEPLELIFKRIGSRYVYWYNWKYNRRGHLFQDRFKSEPIDTEEYFLTVLRYIHDNPLKAGLSKNVYSYKYSSAKDYLNGTAELVDIDFAIGMMGKETLLDFFNEPTEDCCMDENSANARINDKEAALLIQKISGAKNTLDVQNFDISKRNVVLAELRKKGLSIRQISRLTGVSFNVVRKF